MKEVDRLSLTLECAKFPENDLIYLITYVHRLPEHSVHLCSARLALSVTFDEHQFIEVLPYPSFFSNSNIIEDLEVLRVLNRVISEICVSSNFLAINFIVSIETVKSNTFEILLAIDDVISAGIRESTSVAQVRSALDMESSEEKLHLMLMKARVPTIVIINLPGK